MTKNEITKEKYKVLGSFKNRELLEICGKSSNEDIKVNINTLDIFYDYESGGNKISEKRKEKVIILTKDQMEENIKIKIWKLFFRYNLKHNPKK